MSEDNEIRTANASVATDAYLAHTDGDEGTALVDLLTDLMHLAEDNGDNFASALRTATMHYEAEK